MGNWYFVVGLILGGASGYIANELLPKKDKPMSVVVGWGMLALWGPILFLALVAATILVGIFLGKVLLRGSEGIYPKLLAVWKAFD